MPTSRIVEIAVGAFIALGLAALFMLAMKVSDITALGDDSGYRIHARFENVGGLKVRAPVTMAGVRIGRVAAITIDPQSFEAVATLVIRPQYANLPEDSNASILTAGLVGEQYVGLEPGGADRVLKDGDTIKLTQSALVIEKLVGRFLANMSDGGN